MCMHQHGYAPGAGWVPKSLSKSGQVFFDNSLVVYPKTCGAIRTATGVVSSLDPACRARPYKIASCVSGLNTCIFFIFKTTSVFCPIRAWLCASTRATMLCSPAVK